MVYQKLNALRILFANDLCGIFVYKFIGKISLQFLFHSLCPLLLKYKGFLLRSQ